MSSLFKGFLYAYEQDSNVLNKDYMTVPLSETDDVCKPKENVSDSREFIAIKK